MIPNDYIPLIYNPLDYINDLIGLTITEGDLRYNRKYGLNYCSDLFITGNIYQNGNIISLDGLVGLEYISDITPGTAISSKALVLDSNRDISNIRNLSCTGDINILGDYYKNSSLINLDSITGITPGATLANKSLIVDSNKDISGIRNLSCSTINLGSTVSDRKLALFANTTTYYGFGASESEVKYMSNVNHRWFTGSSSSNVGTSTMFLNSSGLLTVNQISGTLTTASQPNITSLGTLSSLNVSGNISGTLTTASQPNVTSVGTLTSITTSGDLTLGATVISETDIVKVDGITNGTASANKALVVDGDVNITGINSLSSTSITGQLQTAAQPNITSIGNLNSLVLTPTNFGVSPNNIDGCVFRTNSSRIFGFREVNSNEWAFGWAGGGNYSDTINIYNGGSTRIFINGDVNIPAGASYKVNGVALPSSIDTAKIAGITNGICSADKALIVDSNKRITEINRVGLTNSIDDVTDFLTMSNPSCNASIQLGLETLINSSSNMILRSNDQNVIGIYSDASASICRLSFNNESTSDVQINNTLSGGKLFISSGSSIVGSQLTISQSDMIWDDTFECKRKAGSGYQNILKCSNGTQLCVIDNNNTDYRFGTTESYDLAVMTNNTKRINFKGNGDIFIPNTSLLDVWCPIVSQSYISMGRSSSNQADILLNLPSSYVGIGSSDVSGSVLSFRECNSDSTWKATYATLNAAAFTVVSDRRMKQDIMKMESVIDDIMAIDCVDYSLISKPDIRESGFIAQDLKNIIPSIVNHSGDDNDMMSVDYGRMTVFLTKAIQELKNEIDKLKNSKKKNKD